MSGVCSRFDSGGRSCSIWRPATLSQLLTQFRLLLGHLLTSSTPPTREEGGKACNGGMGDGSGYQQNGEFKLLHCFAQFCIALYIFAMFCTFLNKLPSVERNFRPLSGKASCCWRDIHLFPFLCVLYNTQLYHVQLYKTQMYNTQLFNAQLFNTQLYNTQLFNTKLHTIVQYTDINKRMCTPSQCERFRQKIALSKIRLSGVKRKMLLFCSWRGIQIFATKSAVF